MRVKKIDFYNLLILSIMFDAYALFYIQNFPVTLFTIVSVLFIFRSLINGRIFKIAKVIQNYILLLLIGVLILNYILNDFKYLTSFVQMLYFLILGLSAYRKEPLEKFNRYCNLFQKLMTYMSIYGIYQFIGRLFDFPFVDIVVPGHMVSGYNWTNSIYILGHTVYRSNAIFREPSYFGQMLAISLILYVPEIISKDKKSINIYVAIIIQAIAMIATISGTGIMMLGFSFIIYCLMTMKRKKFWRRIFPIAIVVSIIAVFALLFTKFGNYFLMRAEELFVYNKDASSGFVRFRAWLLVVKEAWTTNWLFGSGIGSAVGYVQRYAVQFFGMTLNGFAKVSTELGFVGVFLWSAYILSFLQKKNNIELSSGYLMLTCSMIPLIFMHEASTSNIFWLFTSLLNCSLIDYPKCSCDKICEMKKMNLAVSMSNLSEGFKQ